MTAQEFVKSTWRRVLDSFRQSFMAGLLVLIPLVLTVWLFILFVGWIDAMMLALPKHFGLPSRWYFDIPGFGVLLGIIFIYLTGLFVRNFFGNFLVNLWNRFIHRVPVIGSIYDAISQMVKSMIGDPKKRFGRVVMIPYPHKDIWALAFVTKDDSSERIQNAVGEECLNVFLPTSPNPTSGLFLIVPKTQVKAITMSVDDAFKVIVSGGIISK